VALHRPLHRPRSIHKAGGPAAAMDSGTAAMLGPSHRV